MGGCRCSYRNCTVKSDGKTHMFHYPVFDKARCHQWILNCQRYEYLNLTVSQVRNRVVCQHHFKDDCFMNFKKGKLKFDAVPTEDGPYCTPKENVDINSQSVAKAYSLVVDDIDNDCSFIDRKANSCTKYEDFLTSAGDMVMENVSWQQDDQKQTISKTYYPIEQYVTPLGTFEALDNAKIIDNNNIDDWKPPHTYSKAVQKKSTVTKTLLPHVSYKSNNFNMEIPVARSAKSSFDQTLGQTQIVEPVVPDSLLSVLKYAIHYEQGANLNVSNHILTDNQNNQYPSMATAGQANKQIKESKIKILSEKTISEPVSFVGKLEPVSPSFILRLPVKKTFDEIPKADASTCEALKCVNKNVLQTEIEIEPNVCNNEDIYNNSDIKLREVIPKSLYSKNKIPAERIVAIEKKRNFNKKLVDIIESCLETTDTKVPDTDAPIVMEHEHHNLTDYTNRKETLKGSQDKTIAYLESRMKEMENVLLRKIDQNSQRIIDLKDTVTPRKSFNISTQTYTSKEAYKKYLYKEISKFLSPNANNLVYEELFLNKYAEKRPSPEAILHRKRRKR